MNLIPIVVIIAVVVIFAVVIGVIIAQRNKKAKTVSFESAADSEQKQLTQQQRSGNYQAQGEFSFAPAQAPMAVKDAVPATPPVGSIQEPELPHEEAPIVDSEQPLDHQVESESDADKAAEEAQAVVEEAAQLREEEQLRVETEQAARDNFDALEEFDKSQPDTANTAEAEAQEAALAADVVAEAAAEAREVSEPSDAEEVPAAEAVTDSIDPAVGRIGRLRGRLARSHNVFGKSVLGMLSAGDLDEEAWEDIEALLIQADLGVGITTAVVDQLRQLIAERGVENEAQARAMLRECLINACKPELDRSIKAMPYDGKPAVVLVVGVNGTGKTTTTGKLARVLVSLGHSVVLGAADTFRAAAADQLETWGRRVNAHTVRGAEGADPASVAFDAVAYGVDSHADVVLIDTAGRLHNSSNLMDQLGKVKRVVEKKAVVDEVLLVLDATTGQNGQAQARTFSEVVNITGVVLTKLDGTAKGGIVFQVQEELGVPVKLVGLGEGSDDLAPFEVEGFVDALLG
ncbi:signal recognition particle-docking protein FtsY [Corynebacterium diphtheriae]|uniref:signal recognition particle-docking protein FtsY n=1 Tax=Corynebacterium diphtheriae TaxID=1717 RepID=UPI00092885FB|nr:signal recognition particle-docking protein FtsY [Corynebacterium diphtheriae]OWN40937.1 signal recognition particle-docking protein FtsY [Corynebacterium belfantii]OJH97715.1 signal recognition particle-docking protein FtsY [Corynebacterium diphtheriae]OWN01729.1 signal recognition particle-docking protein FtsY [Corynebacterium diphtheriae bv. mitis]OWN27153.1 signal recognition particle-docking protein FtsY [Corynebacterium diphtheriae bv. mitis]OWO24819.1 signal recognition particle-dock